MPTSQTTSARGYGHTHQQAKQRLAPTIERDGAICTEPICLEPSRVIPPGTTSKDWDLAHDRTNPGHYLGPAHPRCNRSEGATFGNQQRGRSKRRWTL